MDRRISEGEDRQYSCIVSDGVSIVNYVAVVAQVRGGGVAAAVVVD